jgi:hypothetical protein
VHGEKPVTVPRGGFAVKLKLRGPSLAWAKAMGGALAMPQKCPEILQSIYERHLVEVLPDLTTILIMYMKLLITSYEPERN